MSSGPTRAIMSRSKNQSLMVIGCNDETNASVLNKENTPHNDDDDNCTNEDIYVDDVSVPRK